MVYNIGNDVCFNFVLDIHKFNLRRYGEMKIFLCVFVVKGIACIRIKRYQTNSKMIKQ